MWKAILHHVKATFPKIAVVLLSTTLCDTAFSQQHIIANKDNTRPETQRRLSSPARINAFVATRYNGFNEVTWTATGEQSTRKFILEYSHNGIDYQSAGQVLSANGVYLMKHHLLDNRPLLYRIRIEEFGGHVYYSDAALLDGIGVSPVIVYPTTVTGNVINANAGFPVERVMIISSDGNRVFAKDLNGARDFIPIAIPAMNRGVYFITFYGTGWKSTSKFMIG